MGSIIVSEGVLGPQGDIRSLCFQLVTDLEIPVTAEAAFSRPFLLLGFRLPSVSHRRLGEHRRWSQNGHNKSATLTSYAIDG